MRSSSLVSTCRHKVLTDLAAVLGIAWIGSCCTDCSGCGDNYAPAQDAPGTPDSPDAGPAGGHGFPDLPADSRWVGFYGTAQEMGDLAQVAATFRVIDIDADPDIGNFTADQIAILKAGGKNRVLSYFSLGSCEQFRSYWAKAPPGFVSCGANTAAHRGSYDGYPDETWMDVGDADYQHLLIDYIAPRLVAQGVDGFYFDNLEIVEHGTSTKNGPCDARCRQGGLDLVRQLRERFPDLLFVMQNATSDITRLGRTGGLDYPALLDGISHEEVYTPEIDTDAQAELLAWAALGLRPNGHAFWIATEDYVGDCDAAKAAQAVYKTSRAHGFMPYVTDSSDGQKVVCYWPF